MSNRTENRGHRPRKENAHSTRLLLREADRAIALTVGKNVTEGIERSLALASMTIQAAKQGKTTINVTELLAELGIKI